MKRSKYNHSATLLQLLEVAASTSGGIPLESMRLALHRSKKRHSYIDDEAEDEESWSRTVQIVRTRLLDIIGTTGITIKTEPYPSVQALGWEIRTAMKAYTLRFGFHRAPKFQNDPLFGEILIDLLVYAFFKELDMVEFDTVECAKDEGIEWYYSRMKDMAMRGQEEYSVIMYEVQRANMFFLKHNVGLIVGPVLEAASDHLELSVNNEELYEALDQEYKKTLFPISHREFLRIKAELEVKNK